MDIGKEFDFIYIVMGVIEGSDFYSEITGQAAFENREEALSWMNAEYSKSIATIEQEGTRLGTNNDIGAPWCGDTDAVISVGSDSNYTRLCWTLSAIELQ